MDCEPLGPQILNHKHISIEVIWWEKNKKELGQPTEVLCKILEAFHSKMIAINIVSNKKCSHIIQINHIKCE